MYPQPWFLTDLASWHEVEGPNVARVGAESGSSASLPSRRVYAPTARPTHASPCGLRWALEA